MHTTMIRASITAYSTAVGPSSRFRKFTTAFLSLRIGFWSFCSENCCLLPLLLFSSLSSGPAPALRGGSRSCRGVKRHVVKGVAGVGTERTDRRDAHDDNQSQHHRVLDRRRAVFLFEEVSRSGDPLLHTHLPFLTPHRAREGRGSAWPLVTSQVSSLGEIE